MALGKGVDPWLGNKEKELPCSHHMGTEEESCMGEEGESDLGLLPTTVSNKDLNDEGQVLVV